MIYFCKIIISLLNINSYNKKGYTLSQISPIFYLNIEVSKFVTFTRLVPIFEVIQNFFNLECWCSQHLMKIYTILTIFCNLPLLRLLFKD